MEFFLRKTVVFTSITMLSIATIANAEVYKSRNKRGGVVYSSQPPLTQSSTTLPTVTATAPTVTATAPTVTATAPTVTATAPTVTATAPAVT